MLSSTKRKIIKSILHKEEKLTEEEIYEYSIDDTGLFVNYLFQLTEELLKKYPKTKNLYNVEYIFEYLEYLVKKNPNIDKKEIINKINKLMTKIQLTLDKIKNKKVMTKNLLNLKNKITQFKDNIFYISNVHSLEDEFIKKIIEEPINAEYLELLIKENKKFLSIQDSNGISIFRNVVNAYLNSIVIGDKKNFHRYNEIINMMQVQPSFLLSKEEYALILNDINNTLDKILNTSQTLEEKKSQGKQLQILYSNLEIDQRESVTIEDLAKKHNINLSFNKSLQSINRDYIKPINIDDYPDRVKINDFVLSIDNNGTKEIDDALSCRKLDNGNYLLGVHIASILAYFDYESLIVQDCFNRVHSIYLPLKGAENMMIPILPYELATNICSLLEGKNRLTRSYIFEIDNNGNIVNQRFMKTIINNNKNLNYEEVDYIFNNSQTNNSQEDNSNEELVTTLQNLKQLAMILGKNYNIKKNISSHDIVYLCMLLTGNKVAEYFASNNYPCLYRVDKIIGELINKDRVLCLPTVKTGCYNIYGRHNELGLNHYCHCTSALRRASDIIVEHALEVCYDRTPTLEDLILLKEDILKKRDLIDDRSKSIERFTSDVDKNIKTKRLKHKVSLDLER